jgi:peptidoglycan/xylan/chitin deacetylase (PgdA/CDA1 family)
MILTYHEIVDQRTSYLYSVTRGQFESHLRLIRELSAEGTRPKELRPRVTFDDGHISNYELALPLLESQGIDATFFVTTDWVRGRRGFMNWSQLREISSLGHEVHSHGASHELLTHCSSAQLCDELQRSKQDIEDALGVAVTAISVPGGRCDDRVLEACSRSGYRQVYVSEPTFRTRVVNHIEMSGRLMIRRTMTECTLRPYLLENASTLLMLHAKGTLKNLCRSLLGDENYAKVWRVIAAKDEASYD